MKATTLLLRQHQRLAQVACALEHERHHIGPLRWELVDDFDRHLTMVAHLVSSVTENAPCARLVALAWIGEARRLVDRLRVEEPGQATFVDAVRDLRALLVRHAELLAEHLLVPMEESLTSEELETLGDSAERASRPYPMWLDESAGAACMP